MTRRFTITTRDRPFARRCGQVILATSMTLGTAAASGTTEEIYVGDLRFGIPSVVRDTLDEAKSGPFYTATSAFARIKGYSPSLTGGSGFHVVDGALHIPDHCNAGSCISAFWARWPNTRDYAGNGTVFWGERTDSTGTRREDVSRLFSTNRTSQLNESSRDFFHTYTYSHPVPGPGIFLNAGPSESDASGAVYHGRRSNSLRVHGRTSEPSLMDKGLSTDPVNVYNRALYPTAGAVAEMQNTLTFDLGNRGSDENVVIYLDIETSFRGSRDAYPIDPLLSAEALEAYVHRSSFRTTLDFRAESRIQTLGGLVTGNLIDSFRLEEAFASSSSALAANGTKESIERESFFSATHDGLLDQGYSVTESVTVAGLFGSSYLSTPLLLRPKNYPFALDDTVTLTLDAEAEAYLEGGAAEADHRLRFLLRDEYRNLLRIVDSTGGGLIELPPALAGPVIDTVTTDDFGGSLFEHWSVSGPGSAEIVALPGDAGMESVLKLTTASPVSVSRPVDTPSSDFRIDFDYRFETTSGVLDVLLNAVLIASIAAPTELAENLGRYRIDVASPDLFGLNDVFLEFAFDGPAGSVVYIDNLAVGAVPVPPAIVLIGTGLVFLLRRRGRPMELKKR